MVTPWAPSSSRRESRLPWTPCPLTIDCHQTPPSLLIVSRQGALHRWYLDDGIFVGSVAEVEEVLGALRQNLPRLRLELNLRKTTFWGPGLVPVSSPLTAATRLHLEEGTQVLG